MIKRVDSLDDTSTEIALDGIDAIEEDSLIAPKTSFPIKNPTRKKLEKWLSETEELAELDPKTIESMAYEEIQKCALALHKVNLDVEMIDVDTNRIQPEEDRSYDTYDDPYPFEDGEGAVPLEITAESKPYQRKLTIDNPYQSEGLEWNKEDKRWK